MVFTTIAIGSRYYGELAINLVNSLNLCFPKAAVYVFSDGSFEQAQGYDRVNATVIKTTETNAFRLKCNLYNEFEGRFIFIDADTIVMNEKAAQKWVKGQKSGLFIQVMPPNQERFMWASKAAIAAHHDIDADQVKHLNSSIITGGTRIFWEQAAEYYDTPMKSARIGGFYPDEIPLAAAIAKSNTTLKAGEPVYLPWSSGNAQDYAFISLPGGNPSSKAIRLYQGIVNRNALKTGVPAHKFQLKRKVATHG